MVRSRPAVCSLVLDAAVSVASSLRVLERWIPVEDPVEDSKGISQSVTEKFVDASVCEVTGDELLQAGSGRLVLVALTFRGGVDSEVSSAVELC